MARRLLALVPSIALLSFLGGCSREHGPAAEFSPAARELCEHLARCETSVTVDECLTEVEPTFDRALASGCVAEANAANTCTLGALVPADGGTCDYMAAAAACDAPYRAYNECAGGGMELSCLSDHGVFEACYTYRGAALDPETTCDALSGMVVATCPAGEILGICTNDISGVELITTYYGPLEPGLTLEALEMTCTDGGGRWSTP